MTFPNQITAVVEPLEGPPAGVRVPSGIERHSFALREMRVAQDEGGSKRLIGYAAVFNAYSENLGGFRELIMPGAFTKTIQEADVRALWNHNPDFVLGRTKADTLRLKEDKHGLAIEIFPPDTQVARDLMTSIERGDVDQMSFTFRTIRDSWGTEEGITTRRLLEAALYDVSPVTFPAYPQTAVNVRALGLDLAEVGAAMSRLEAGSTTPEDRTLLDRLMRQVNTSLAAAPPQERHPAEEAKGGNVPAGTQHSFRKRRLDLLRKV